MNKNLLIIIIIIMALIAGAFFLVYSTGSVVNDGSEAPPHRLGTQPQDSGTPPPLPEITSFEPGIPPPLPEITSPETESEAPPLP